MANELDKINIVTIIVSGIMMALVGLGLYLFRDALSNNLRYFMPVPPIGVAAYVFVYNVYRQTNGNLPGNGLDTARELLYGTLVAALIFFIFSACILAGTYLLKGR